MRALPMRGSLLCVMDKSGEATHPASFLYYNGPSPSPYLGRWGAGHCLAHKHLLEPLIPPLLLPAQLHWGRGPKSEVIELLRECVVVGGGGWSWVGERGLRPRPLHHVGLGWLTSLEGSSSGWSANTTRALPRRTMLEQGSTRIHLARGQQLSLQRQHHPSPPHPASSIVTQGS